MSLNEKRIELKVINIVMGHILDIKNIYIKQ